MAKTSETVTIPEAMHGNAAAWGAAARQAGLEDGARGERRHVPAGLLGPYLGGFDLAQAGEAWGGTLDVYELEALAIREASGTDLDLGTLTLSFEARRGEHGKAVVLATAYGYSEDNAAVVPILPPVEVPRSGATALLFGQIEAALGRDEVTAEKVRVLRVTDERARVRGIVDGMARAGAGIAEALS